MFRELFLGRNPTHFHINPLVKAYIVSESFLWSAWNFILPLFSLFIVNEVQNGSIKIAAWGYSIYLIARVIFELITGKFLAKSKDKEKLITTCIGIVCLSIGYLGFVFSHQIAPLLIFYSLLGVGLGIASPAKNALFAMHLDHNKEASEWGFMDATVFICTALAAALGGFIADSYGFSVLFIIAGILNLLSLIPYGLYFLKG